MSGSTLVSHVDRLSSEDLETMVTSLTGHSAHHSTRLQLSIIGAFQDNKNVSQSLLIPVLGKHQSFIVTSSSNFKRLMPVKFSFEGMRE